MVIVIGICVSGVCEINGSVYVFVVDFICYNIWLNLDLVEIFLLLELEIVLVEGLLIISKVELLIIM